MIIMASRRGKKRNVMWFQFVSYSSSMQSYQCHGQIPKNESELLHQCIIGDDGIQTFLICFPIFQAPCLVIKQAHSAATWQQQAPVSESAVFTSFSAKYLAAATHTSWTQSGVSSTCRSWSRGALVLGAERDSNVMSRTSFVFHDRLHQLFSQPTRIIKWFLIFKVHPPTQTPTLSPFIIFLLDFFPINEDTTLWYQLLG